MATTKDLLEHLWFFQKVEDHPFEDAVKAEVLQEHLNALPPAMKATANPRTWEAVRAYEARAVQAAKAAVQEKFNAQRQEYQQRKAERAEAARAEAARAAEAEEEARVGAEKPKARKAKPVGRRAKK
jgi:hypothetical protein